MRPLRLTMQAFGPYRTAQLLDFSDLGANKLFLIHGQTGAGKTTVLDAMCYALYGDTSGGSRNGSQMRCESADSQLRTEVTFDFALGDRRYRVKRAPKQELSAQRGSGTVTKQTEATLWEIDAAGAEAAVVANKIGEVNSRVKELLGFSSEQFRQVVILPQGRFRDVLDASSDKREEILRQLFRTDRFAAVERLLSDRARDVAEERKKLRTRREVTLDHVQADSDEALEVLIAHAESSVEVAGIRADHAAVQCKAAGAALQAAEDADQAQRSLADANRDLEVLKADGPEIAALEHSVELAIKAQQVEPLHAAVKAAQAESEQAARDLERLQVALDQALTAEESAAAQFAAEQRRESERLSANESVHTLKQAAEAVARLLEAEASRLKVEVDYETAADAVATAKLAVEEARTHLSAAVDGAERLESVVRERDDVAQLLAQATEIAGRCDRMAQAHDGLMTCEAQCATAGAAVGDASAALQEAEAECVRIEAAWREARSAALASTLVEGDPCPVCGSLEHPAPATAHAAIDDAALDAARNRVADSRSALDAARSELAIAEQGMAGLTATAQTLALELGDAGSVVAANERVSGLKAQLAHLTAQIDGLSAAAELLADRRETLAEVESRLSAAESAEKTASKLLAAAKADSAARGESIPEELRVEGAVDAALAEALSRAEALREALEQARQVDAQSREARISAEGELKAAEEVIASAARRLTNAQEALAVALSRAGFTKSEEFLGARLCDEAVVAGRARIDGYREAIAAAVARVAEAEKAAMRHSTAGGIEMLRESLLQAEGARDQAFAERESALAHRAALHKTRDDVASIDADFARVEERYQVVGMLSEVANGQAGGAKVSFQRWVLGTYLDDVLVAATRRLATMSKGRYTLERQRVATDRKRATGLDLAVFDGWSNRSRAAVTLSGGESFLAALSLALGLAATVQEQAGGTPLETVFIDEGFGALDSDALDLAMEALVELKDTGRLVGVISHVPELRQVIDARLEVSGGPSGSTARFVVP